jgi:hypothetical protein
MKAASSQFSRSHGGRTRNLQPTPTVMLATILAQTASYTPLGVARPASAPDYGAIALRNARQGLSDSVDMEW